MDGDDGGTDADEGGKKVEETDRGWAGLGEGRAQMPPLPPPLPLMFYSTHPDWFKSFAKK